MLEAVNTFSTEGKVAESAKCEMTFFYNSTNLVKNYREVKIKRQLHLTPLIYNL